MSQEIILIGGGGHCKACIDVIEQAKKFHISGIIDKPDKIGQNVLGYPIIASDDKIEEIIKKYNFFLITIGFIRSPVKRNILFKKIKHMKGEFPIIISPRAYVSRHSAIGEGTIIMHNVVINAKAQIGDNCIINTGAIIEHDVKIGNNCHISTGAVINGGVIINENTFFGSGAIAIQDIIIPRDRFIKANTLVKDSK